MQIKKLFNFRRNKKEPLKRALICFQAGDLDLCRQALQEYLSITSIGKIKKLKPDNFDQGNAILEMLFNLDFDDYPEGSAPRILYLTVFLYLIKNAPPDIKRELNQELEKVLSIEPTGYTINDEPCFNMVDVAKILGISEEEAINILEKTGDLKSDNEIFKIN